LPLRRCSLHEWYCFLMRQVQVLRVYALASVQHKFSRCNFQIKDTLHEHDIGGTKECFQEQRQWIGFFERLNGLWKRLSRGSGLGSGHSHASTAIKRSETTACMIVLCLAKHYCSTERAVSVFLWLAPYLAFETRGELSCCFSNLIRRFSLRSHNSAHQPRSFLDAALWNILLWSFHSAFRCEPFSVVDNTMDYVVVFHFMKLLH